MKHLLVKLLNLRYNETKMVFRLLAVQFVMGLGVAFLVTASYSLFLYQFATTQLPLVYIATAILLFPVNAVYAWADTRFNSRKLFEITLLICASAVAVGLGIWALSQSLAGILILLAVNITVYMLLGYAYWGMASLLFDVREGRRVFSVIGAGDIPAKMIGYALVPLIAKFAGLEGAMIAAIFLFVAAFVLAIKLLRSAGINWDAFEHHQQHPDFRISITQWWSRIFGDKLIFRISMLSFLGYLVYFLVDFSFLTEIKVRNKSADELIQFLALFFFIGRGLALVLKLLFTSRFLLRLGIMRTLFFTPMVLLVIVFGLLMLAVLRNEPLYYLYGFGVLTLFSEVLRSSVQEPVFFVLFQPLSIHLRLKGHLIAKGYILPPAFLLIGGILLYYLSANQGIVDLHHVVICLLVLLAAWMGVLPLVRNAYRQTVTQAMGQSFFAGTALFLDDTDVAEKLLEKVEKGNAIQIIHALDLLERSGYAEIRDLLHSQLSRPLPEVVLYAMERLGTLGWNEKDIQPLLVLAENDTQPELAATALAALLEADQRYASRYTIQPDEAHPAVQLAMIKAARHRDDAGAVQMLLRNLSLSNRFESRCAAAGAIGRLELAEHAHLLEILIQDAVPEVSRAAIESAGLLQIPSMIPVLLIILEDEKRRPFAINALQHYGDELFIRHELSSGSLSQSQVVSLAAVAAAGNGPSSVSWLLAQMEKYAAPSQAFLIDALWLQGKRVSAQHAHRVENAISAWLKLCQLKETASRQLNGMADWQLLATAIRSEVKDALMHTVKLCGLLYGPEKFQRVLQVIRMSDAKPQVAAALETIELNVKTMFATRLSNLLEWALTSDEKAMEAALRRQELPLETLESILTRFGAFSEWTIGLLFYLMGKRATPAFLPLVERRGLENNPSPFIHENYLYLKSRLEN